MFEAIGTLFTIAIWAVAIFMFGGGIIICIGNLISGSGLERVMAVIAIILGVITFYYTYDWLESIVWCMLFSGLVLGLGNAGSDKVEKAPQRAEKCGVTDAFMNAYIEEKVIEEAVTNAIRKSKE